MNFRRATNGDIAELVRLRILFLNEVNGIVQQPEGFDGVMERHFEAAFADGSFTAWLALEDGIIVATSGMCYYAVMPNYSNPTGMSAYIQNMYTLPEYRGRGLASELFGRLISDARAKGCKTLSLHATAEGRRVYTKFGFAGNEEEMSLKL